MIKTARITTTGVTRPMHRSVCTPMQQQCLQKAKPAYAAYLQQVPAFFPWRTQ
jgi:steroid 5-alpha reductase family enzyme